MIITAESAGGGSAIDHFQCVDKNGVTYTFGGTTGSSQQGGGEPSGLIYRYALSEVRDPLGNYVTFSYTPLRGGEYVLSEIDYTGNDGTALNSTHFAEREGFLPVREPAGRAGNLHRQQGVQPPGAPCYHLGLQRDDRDRRIRLRLRQHFARWAGVRFGPLACGRRWCQREVAAHLDHAVSPRSRELVTAGRTSN